MYKRQVVKVQDNKTFSYQLVANDADGDSLNFRWGTRAEFFAKTPEGTASFLDGSYLKPTGMTLSSSGLVSWDVRDTVLDNGSVDSRWIAVMMVQDLDSSGNIKSYIPLDFVFKIADPDNDPPEIFGLPTTTQTVRIGTTKTFTLTSTDDRGVAPTVLSLIHI